MSENPEPPIDAAYEPAKNEYYEKYLRALADFQNYQKRARLEADRAKEETIRKMLLGFLPVYDNFDLAAKADPTNYVLSGIKEQFMTFLVLHGIKELVPVPGDAFNSELHEAVMFSEGDVETMKVDKVWRSGYALSDKVLRSAQVSVIKPRN